MHTKGVVCMYAVVSMATGNMFSRKHVCRCMYVLRVRYLRVSTDSQGTLGNCTLLFAKPSLSYLISVSLSTSPWVTAVGDALPRRSTGVIQIMPSSCSYWDKEKLPSTKGCTEQFSWGAFLIRFFLPPQRF